jgi:hypothetical protein
MTNDARCAGKLARAKGPTFEAEGELARAAGVIRHLSSRQPQTKPTLRLLPKFFKFGSTPSSVAASAPNQLSSVAAY